MAKFELANAIQMGQLANLKAIAASIPEGDRDVRVTGYVIGKVTGISYRSNPNGDEPSKALIGMFEATPTEEGRAVIRASRCFLPSNLINVIEAEIRGEQAAPKKAPPKGQSIDLEGVAEIRLAVQLGIRKSNNAIGYEHVAEILNDDASASDALADVRGFLPKEIARVAAPPALPAPDKPAKAKAKGRGKK